MPEDKPKSERNPQSKDSRFVFSKKAGDYAAARPDYPAALFEALKSICPPAGNLVADIGAGTGLLTQGLLHSGYQVIAVEPNAEMRHEADLRLAKSKDYRSLDGSAEATSLAGGSVDLITVAQAFHWFDVERARAEFLRILKPHGKVALISNERLRTDPLNIAIEDLFKSVTNKTRTTSNLGNAPLFFGTGTFEKKSWPHEHSLDDNGLVSLVFSRSHMPGRDSDEGVRMTDRIREIFQRFEVAGMVKVRYETVMLIGRPQ